MLAMTPVVDAELEQHHVIVARVRKADGGHGSIEVERGVDDLRERRRRDVDASTCKKTTEGWG